MEPTGRESCYLAAHQTVCLLFVRGVRNDSAATSGPQSVGCKLKWDIGMFYLKKKRRKKCFYVSLEPLHQYSMFTVECSSCACVFPRRLLWHLVAWEAYCLSLQHHGEPDVLGQHCQLPRPGAHVSVHIMVYRYLHNWLFVSSRTIFFRGVVDTRLHVHWSHIGGLIFQVVNHFQMRWGLVSALSPWQLWPHLLKPSLYGCQARVSGLVRQTMIKAIL